MTPELICGDRFADHRGKLDFFNSLDLSEVVRMYRISPSDTGTIRAWQGHKKERKWFFCIRGAFVVNLLPLSEFLGETSVTGPEVFTLQADLLNILRIPAGYANGFRAIEPDSELLVLSDLTLEASKEDDYRFNIENYAFIDPN